MVTTRSQDRNVEESDLPLRSRPSDAPSDSTLKRARSTIEDPRTTKRGKISHEPSPAVKNAQRDGESNEIHEAAPVTIDLPEQCTDSALETSPFIPESIDGIQHDNYPPLKPNTISNVISEDSAAKTDRSPEQSRGIHEELENTQPTTEVEHSHTRYDSDSQSQTYIMAASAPGFDNLRDLTAPTSDAGQDHIPDCSPLGTRADSIQDYPAIQFQRQGESETNSKSYNFKERDFADSPAPETLNPPRNPENMLTYTVRKPTSQRSRPEQLQAISSSPNRLPSRPPPVAIRTNTKTTHLQHPVRVISQSQPSSSLSRYKQTAFERHKRTPHWAGKKPRFVDVGVGVGAGLGVGVGVPR
jgi:hypothetical protein